MSSVSSVSSSQAYTSSASSSASSNLDMSDFLTLMCVQLQNQNPLNPSDPKEYMSQLVSYASLNEASETNTRLGNVTTALASLLAASAVGYVGRTVEAVGDTNSLTNGSATWNYQLASNATKVTIKITDESGKTVYTTTGETSEGEHSFTWDALSSKTAGAASAGGTYKISVTATDADGKAITTSTTVVGVVTGVDSSSGTVMLKLGDAEVPFANIVAIKS